MMRRPAGRRGIVIQVAVAVALTGLTGCATPLLDGMTHTVSAVAVPDLLRAEAAAVASGDSVAAPCYAALLPLLQRLGDPDHAAIGLFSALQAARDLDHAKAALATACGPLSTDLMLAALRRAPGLP